MIRPDARGRALRLSLLAALALPGRAPAQETTASAEGALRAGRYAEAVELARAAAVRDPAAARVLVRALAETGRYAEADSAAAASGLASARGEALLARGRLAEAEAAFRQAVERRDPDHLLAELNLAVLLHERGEREEAARRFDRFIDVYNGATALRAAELTAVGTAVRYLGARDPQLFKDAVKAYEEAIAADAGDFEPRLRLGELFLEKYDGPEARAAFAEVLAANPSHPRALLGMARVREFDGATAEATALVRRSLEVNPDLVPARVALARLLLAGEDAAGAEAEIERALRVNPASLDALSVLAAIRFVRGDRAGYEEARTRVQRLNPSHAGLYTTVAEVAANHRRYAQAAELAAEAVRLDPAAWAAHGVLGLNLLRLGRVEEARASLERSFQGDPYNAWIKNTLDLLDTFSQYEIRRTEHFEFLLHRDEADLLFPYLAELGEEAYRRMGERYGFRPQAPVRVEVYPRHADFSVRTVGMVGLGALGVSFGNVLAIGSPRARDAGDFNWGATLWHELAHAVTLGLSGNRVPRWLTEGLSVLEERRARPGWGSESTPAFVSAYLSGELPPLSRLNEGFTRPKSPGHVGLSYHLASLAAEWIEETRGFPAIVRMLRSYREGRGTEAVLRGMLGADPQALDRQFDAWLRARLAPQIAALARPADRVARGAAGRRLLESGAPEVVARQLEAEAAVFPMGDGESPYAALAQLHLKRGDPRAATAALARLAEVDETAYAESRQLAELLERAGDAAGAAAALERAVTIYPYDIALHQRLAELYARTGDRARAVRERRAVVALAPVDRAEALYQLALALLEAGERDAARREVLRALEAAPGFERAQDLLLRLHGPGGGPGTR